MKTYRARLKKGAKGVYGISLVDQPAMEGDFIQFSKQEEVKFAEVDKSKRRVMGLVLEPNKLVYRNQGGEEFNVMFEAQDIEDVAYNFQTQKNQNNSTIQHSGESIEGVSFVETWLVENPKMDKSVNFGFEYPKGSWMAVMQIENEDVWLNYVETGKVKGFSIDALMSFEEVNLNKQIDMDEKTILELLKDLPNKLVLAMSSKKEDKVELSEEVKAEEIEKEVVAEATETEEVEASTETKEEVVEEVKEEAIAMSKEDIDKVISERIELAVTEQLKPLESKNSELEAEKVELEKKVKEQKEKIVELGKEPATASINSNPVQLKYSEMSNFQKLLHNRGQL